MRQAFRSRGPSSLPSRLREHQAAEQPRRRLYSFRYRNELPAKVLAKQPTGLVWVIFPAKIRPSAYRFAAVPFATVNPTPGLTVTKIPDATPGLIDLYAKGDEQALLAKLRYNRLLDIYSGVTTYSLQSHLRTRSPNRKWRRMRSTWAWTGYGAHYVFPSRRRAARTSFASSRSGRTSRCARSKFPGSARSAYSCAVHG